MSELHGHTIRIGIGAPLSGSSAVLGLEMKQAIEMAIEECNASGGILGAAVVAQTADDEGSEATGERVAREFCSQADLLGVVGHYFGSVSIPASTIYSESGLAMVTPIASEPEVTDRGLPNVFRFTNRDDITATAMAEYLANHQKHEASDE